MVDSFLHQFTQSPNQAYAVYMAGLTNAATGDNFIQDFLELTVLHVKQPLCVPLFLISKT